jgi:uncharacterized protein
MIIRNIEEELIKELYRDTILTMIGARQVGKTTLLNRLQKYLSKKNKAVNIFTLEDKTLLSHLNDHPKNIFNYVDEDIEHQYLLIDEIQYLNDPSNFLKYMYDLHKDKIKLIVTGSSAFYIDKKYKDSLAGRKKLIYLKPFTFSEFLLTKNEEILSNKIKEFSFFYKLEKMKLLIPQKDKILNYLKEYFMFGGYPKVVLEKDKNEKKEILKELHLSFLQKDILEAGIKNEFKFYDLLKLLASQAGELLNVNELSNTLNISRDAIKHYLYIMEKSFIINPLRPFHNNIRIELTKMPKIYFLDTGYRNSILNIFNNLESRIDKGQSFENMFFIELYRKNINDINFWRTKDQNEVDFVVNKKYAFEIKFNSSKFKINKYKAFRKAYENISLNCVSYNNENDGLTIIDFLS